MNGSVRAISDPGTVTLFTGSMGTGKTDIALRYAELSQKKNQDLIIITNIVMMNKTKKFKIEYCNSWFNYLQLIYKYPRSLLVLDEAGIFASSGYAKKGFDVGQWEVFLKLCRKWGVAVFWIDQRDEGSIPPTMREIAYYHVHKPSLFKVEVWRGMRGSKGSQKLSTRSIDERDKTNIPFDTLSPASWINDFPIWSEEGEDRQLTIRDLIDRVSNVNNSEVRPTMKAWFDEIKLNIDKKRLEIERNKEGEGKKNPLTLKEVVFFVMDLDLKNGRDLKGSTEIGKFLGKKPQSIQRIIKEWKDLNPIS